MTWPQAIWGILGFNAACCFAGMITSLVMLRVYYGDRRDMESRNVNGIVSSLTNARIMVGWVMLSWLGWMLILSAWAMHRTALRPPDSKSAIVGPVIMFILIAHPFWVKIVHALNWRRTLNLALQSIGKAHKDERIQDASDRADVAAVLKGSFDALMRRMDGLERQIQDLRTSKDA